MTNTKTLSTKIWNILACPLCGNSLAPISTGAKCSNCQQEYAISSNGQLNLRLLKKKQYQFQFELGTNRLPGEGFEFGVLRKNPYPQVAFNKIKVPQHLSKEIMSYFPRAKTSDSLMLDLGCGMALGRKVYEELTRYEYVGLDYASPEAPILGDAHSLPFKDNAFEFILSLAVLEHIQFPFIVIREAYRVLKPGGKFIGTVAFLEPFVYNSFYHHTHLGIFNSLQSAGFEINHIAPSSKWSVLRAQSMALFPLLPRWISYLLLWPIDLFHRSWWKAYYLITRISDLLLRPMHLPQSDVYYLSTSIARYHSFRHDKITRLDTATEAYRILSTTGSFTFIASKPSDE